MNREQMEDAVFAKTEYEMAIIEMMTDSQLREILGLNKTREPAKPKQRREQIEKPPRSVMTDFEFVEYEGELHRVETWVQNEIESKVRVKCTNTVRFNGRTVSSAIVLHWLRTGEIVKRVPRAPKIRYQAAIRVGGRVIHLGRFETREAVEAAKTAAKFRISLGLSPIG
jgi:hypothetical protein